MSANKLVPAITNFITARHSYFQQHLIVSLVVRNQERKKYSLLLRSAPSSVLKNFLCQKTQSDSFTSNSKHWHRRLLPLIFNKDLLCLCLITLFNLFIMSPTSCGMSTIRDPVNELLTKWQNIWTSGVICTELLLYKTNQQFHDLALGWSDEDNHIWLYVWLMPGFGVI